LIRGVLRACGAQRQDAPKFLFGFRKKIDEPAAFRPEVADAIFARKRRQVEENSASPADVHKKTIVELSGFAGLTIPFQCADFYVGTQNLRDAPGLRDAAAAGVRRLGVANLADGANRGFGVAVRKR
jgi:hypothetical protein